MHRATTARPALLLLVALVAGLLTAGPQTASAAPPRGGFPQTVPLPDGFQPEGIAAGRGTVAYFGSRADGDIYRADLRTGEGEVISQGPGTPSLGMKLDRQGRLFVAGGSGGDGRVVDTRTGEVLRSWTFATAQPTFVNDVVLTKDAAWFTDSQQPVLYRVPLGKDLATQADVETVPLSGEWQQVAGQLNANGIEQTPDRSALLVVQSATGYLFRVEEDGRATRVDLGSTLLTNGDGLLVDGRTLYAVQNRLNQVAEIRLSRDGRSGRLVDTLTTPAFDVPTTVAKVAGALYLPNARFTTPPTPTTTYDAVRLVP